MAKPRETGGNVPGAKPKKVRRVVVKVAPEATRPVTPAQRQAIDRNVARVRKQVVGQSVAKAQTIKQQPDTPQARLGSQVAKINARSQKVDRLQREAAAINAGRKKITLADPEHGVSTTTKVKGSLLRQRKVVVKNGKLYLHTGSVLGMGGSDVPLAGTTGRTYTAIAGVDEATKRITAPALKVLHYTAIPGQAIGKQVEKATGSKAAGFVGSIALDPTTYLTFGRSKVATTLAQRAGERAYKDAVKSGLDHAAATKAATKVANKVEQTAPQNKGIQVKVAGKSTSGRTTAYVSRKTGVSKVATKIRESKPVQGIAQDLRPDFRPKGVSEAEHAAVRSASREARAQTTRGRVEAISKAKALKKALKPEEHAQVVGAIERGTVYNLPDHLRAPAREVELAFRKARKAEVKVGIKTPNRRHYFAHALEEQVTEGAKKGKGGGKRVIRPVYAEGRQHQGTIEQIKAQGGPEFSTNIPGVVAGRLSKSAGDVAQARMNRALAAAGRKVKFGEKVDLKDGEALYKIHGSDIQHLGRWEEEHVLAGTKKPPKEPTQTVTRTVKRTRLEQAAQAKPREVPVHAYDKPAAVKAALRNLAKRDPKKAQAIRKRLREINSEIAFHDNADTNVGTAIDKANALRAERETLLKPLRLPKAKRVTRAETLAERARRMQPREETITKRIPVKRAAVNEPHYVVLNEKAVDNAVKSVAPGASRSTVGRGYDKIQGGFKFAATAPNPGFHARNLYGDTFNAYLGQSTPNLARNLRHSAKGLRALGRQEEAARKITATVTEGAGNKAARRMGKVVKDTRGPEKGITVRGKYGGKEFLSYDNLAKEAVNHGAIRSGFLSREIPELLRDTSKAASGREVGRHLKRLVQNREDLIRLATYIGARQGGKTAREASDWAAKHHFDYADLTDFERTVMRRLLPFYTFSARNIPLQAGKLFTHPGKFANLEKIREYAAQQAGLPADWESRIPEYQQRGIPIPVVVGGEPILVSPSLPVADLNQFTLPGVSADNFGAALSEQGKKFLSMLNPVIKSPVELYANYNFFFRGQIERDNSPLVAAPSYVAQMPKAWRQKLGIVSDYVGQRTGKKGWGWPAKVDYVAKVMPGWPNTVQQLMSPLSNRRGQGQLGKAVSFTTGLKPDPYDPTSTAITNLENRKAELTKQRSALSQRGIGSAKSGRRETPQYRKIRDELKQIDIAVGKLSRQRGDKIAIGKVRKPKAGGSLMSQAAPVSVSDILGHDAPTVNDILGQ